MTPTPERIRATRVLLPQIRQGRGDEPVQLGDETKKVSDVVRRFSMMRKAPAYYIRKEFIGPGGLITREMIDAQVHATKLAEVEAAKKASNAVA